MPGRSTHRRRLKRLARMEAMEPSARVDESARLLVEWRREADRRARSLGAPAAWDLARGYARDVTLDPKDDLQADLNRVCAEAVARQAGGCLVRGSRPLADRCRLDKPKPV